MNWLVSLNYEQLSEELLEHRAQSTAGKLDICVHAAYQTMVTVWYNTWYKLNEYTWLDMIHLVRIALFDKFQYDTWPWPRTLMSRHPLYIAYIIDTERWYHETREMSSYYRFICSWSIRIGARDSKERGTSALAGSSSRERHTAAIFLKPVSFFWKSDFKYYLKSNFCLNSIFYFSILHFNQQKTLFYTHVFFWYTTIHHAVSQKQTYNLPSLLK
jgi:hypothetical protein